MDSLTLDYRKANQRITARALIDLHALWPLVQLEDISGSFVGFLTLMRSVYRSYGLEAADEAANYLNACKLGAGLLTPAVIPEVPLSLAAFDTSLAVASVAGTKTALSAGRTGPQALRIGLTLASGVVSRQVQQVGRETVTQSSALDPESQGWVRALSSGACGFCRMIAGRNVHYKSATARFASHDHCGCSAVPVYGPRDARRKVKDFTPSTRDISEVDKARAKAYIAENYSPSV